MSTPEKKEQSEKKSIIDDLFNTIQTGAQVVKEQAKKEWGRLSSGMEERQIERALKEEHTAFGKLIEAHLLAGVKAADVFGKADVKERLSRMEMLRAEQARLKAEREAAEYGDAPAPAPAKRGRGRAKAAAEASGEAAAPARKAKAAAKPAKKAGSRTAKAKAAPATDAAAGSTAAKPAKPAAKTKKATAKAPKRTPKAAPAPAKPAESPAAPAAAAAPAPAAENSENS